MLDDNGHLVGVLDFVAARAFYPVFDVITPGVFFAAGHPARLAALVEAASLQATPEKLTAWHLLHPCTDLVRDLRMAGRSGVSGQPLHETAILLKEQSRPYIAARRA